MFLPTQTHQLLQLPSISHGFYSRSGGVSEGHYQGLNCGSGSQDNPDHIAQNRRLVRDALGASTLLSLYQVHSAKCVYIETTFTHRPQGDAMVTRTPGLALGALAADCMTVLFAAPEAGLIGAAHAGWKGALAGILENTVACLIEHGGAVHDIRAVFGPCLRPPFFEVGLDLVDQFTDKFPQSARFFSLDTPAGKRQCDLVGFCSWRLETTGLDPANIGDVGGNTLAEPDKYFSYRHSRQTKAPDYGRHVSAISLQTGK